jgi:acetyl esterase/lipase
MFGSAGGNLALALTQLLLEFRRKNTSVQWYGEPRELPLPVAVTTNSPWLDITQSSPSWDGDTSEPFDYLPKPETMARAKIKSCSIWPTVPPRKNIYVDDDLIAHPLASVIMNKSWEGAPPMYMCTGWEILALEDKYLARKLHEDGVKLVFDEYEAMPHCFALILGKAPNGIKCFERWSGFIRQAVEDADGIQPGARTVRAKTLKDVPLEFAELSDVTDEEIQRRVLEKAGVMETSKL